MPWFRITMCGPVIDIYANTQGRDLGAVAADINRIVAEQAGTLLPRGSQVTLRGQVSTMTEAYSQLFLGLGFAIVLIYLLIVVNFQSWIDPAVIVMGLPGALAGIVWMLFLTDTNAVGAGADRRDHVHGRGDGEFHPGDQFRARADGQRHERAASGNGSRRHAVPAGADDGAGNDYRHGADGIERRTECAFGARRDWRAAASHHGHAVRGAGAVQPGAWT